MRVLIAPTVLGEWGGEKRLRHWQSVIMRFEFERWIQLHCFFWWCKVAGWITLRLNLQIFNRGGRRTCIKVVSLICPGCCKLADSWDNDGATWMINVSALQIYTADELINKNYNKKYELKLIKIFFRNFRLKIFSDYIDIWCNVQTKTLLHDYDYGYFSITFIWLVSY